MAKREHWSNWYDGDRSDWEKLPMVERDKLSFKGTGCSVAFPTWEAPVDCVHDRCQVLRGEKKPISLVNGSLRCEMSNGWLRFVDRNDRTKRKALAMTLRTVRNQYFKTGETDIWKMWSVIVGTGIGAAR